MTLLERFDQFNMMLTIKGGVLEHELRRALAIAQAVEELTVYVGDTKQMILRRAEELLK